MRNVLFIPEDHEWMSERVRELFELMRRERSTQQWIRYVSNWPLALNALRKLWEKGRVSELNSPFYELVRRSANNQT